MFFLFMLGNKNKKQKIHSFKSLHWEKKSSIASYTSNLPSWLLLFLPKMGTYVEQYRSTMRGNCMIKKNTMVRQVDAHIGISIHGLWWQKTRNKIAPKATIMADVEINNAQRPTINRLGKLNKKSCSEKRVVRIDKNTSNVIVDVNSETASDIAKIMKAISCVNKGVPFSWLLPPGTVIAAANTIVVISAAVMLQ